MYGAPENFIDILILPMICVTFALLMRLGAWGREKSGGNAKWLKLAAYVPAIFGLWVGFQNLWAMYSPDTGYLYMKTLEGRRKVLVGHYVSFFLPLLTVLGILIWGRVERRLGRPLSI